MGEKSRPHFMLYLLLQVLEAGVCTAQCVRLLLLPIQVKAEWCGETAAAGYAVAAAATAAAAAAGERVLSRTAGARV